MLCVFSLQYLNQTIFLNLTKLSLNLQPVGRASYKRCSSGMQHVAFLVLSASLMANERLIAAHLPN